ncbi:hypothetical protein [Fulvimonas yonginensis]|uniref:Uncharacterized protein n=1 Tax=Fulvimonas yonginensis TaxID=1495200 RepID=A0ABU8JAR6_9GAMM
MAAQTSACLVDAAALKTQVRRAFDDVEPPPWCLAGSAEGTEPALLAREFTAVLDRHWSELAPAFPDQAPGGFGSALWFFSDEAFRFYLSAYLVAALDGQLAQADPVFHLTHGFTQAGTRPINPRRYIAATARD